MTKVKSFSQSKGFQFRVSLQEKPYARCLALQGNSLPAVVTEKYLKHAE